MTHMLLPATWLLILVAGLPQLCETVYTPSLPDIARALQTSEAMAEYTLTIYLFGFALGTLFWGKVSDGLGRKPCVMAGLLVFMIGCIGCYISNSIETFMISRLIQAPLCGGLIAEIFGWKNIFVFLTIFALIVVMLVSVKLPETQRLRESLK